ncbi:hypothetical protein ACSQ67_025470 [Phaseolus vulgaris]
MLNQALLPSKRGSKMSCELLTTRARGDSDLSQASIMIEVLFSCHHPSKEPELSGWKIEAEVKLTGILCLGELQPGEVLALHRFSSGFNIHNLSVIKPCKPMNLVRSYASVVRLNGGIYVFGGGNGYIWYDTIESYNPVHDNWTMHPSLNQKKGSLSDNDNFHAASTNTTFLVFHPQDNNIIAIGMDDSSIQIYNVRVDEVKTKLKVHQEENHWSFDFDNASPEPYLIARRGRASGYEDEKNK